MKLFKNLKYTIYIILITSMTGVFSGCGKKLQEPVSKTEFVMGTVCTIKLYDSSSQEVLDKAFQRIKELEKEMTIRSSGSEVDAINISAGEKTVQVSADTFTVIKRGLYFSQLSEGRFDITIGPLVKLWGIGTDNERVPSDKEILSAKALTDYKAVTINDDNKSVKLNNKNMLMDLGGIAKGYTADETAKVLRANGVKQGIINLGGNILAMDKNPNGNPWRIGIQNPFSDRGVSLGNVEVINKSVVTSGIYERYFEKDGKHYHHILNPFTGYPYENTLAGVTIISDASIDGDALSTTVFAMGLKDGLKFLSSLNGTEGILITKNKEIYITPGLKGNFKITDNGFILK